MFPFFADSITKIDQLSRVIKVNTYIKDSSIVLKFLELTNIYISSLFCFLKICMAKIDIDIIKVIIIMEIYKNYK